MHTRVKMLACNHVWSRKADTVAHIYISTALLGESPPCIVCTHNETAIPWTASEFTSVDENAARPGAPLLHCSTKPRHELTS